MLLAISQNPKDEINNLLLNSDFEKQKVYLFVIEAKNRYTSAFVGYYRT